MRRRRYSRDYQCGSCGSTISGYHYRGCPYVKREEEKLKKAHWGVFPYIGNDGVVSPHRGYVTREVNPDTGYGSHSPYRHHKAIKIFKRKSAADRFGDKLTFGR